MSDLRDTERRIESRRAENEELREDFAVVKTKAEIKEMKERLGETEVREMLTSGAIKLARGGFNAVRKLRVDKENMDSLYGDSSGLRDYNNPQKWGRPK